MMRNHIMYNADKRDLRSIILASKTMDDYQVDYDALIYQRNFKKAGFLAAILQLQGIDLVRDEDERDLGCRASVPPHVK